MKETEWKNSRVAVKNLHDLLNKKDEEDYEYFKELLRIYTRRFERSEMDDKEMEKIGKLSRLLLEELGLRPMPAGQKARFRTPNQVAMWGCPTNPCIGKQHCDIRVGGCGKHGHRYGDGHECKPKFGNE